MTQRDVFVAVADPTRREILDLLREHSPLPAGDIATRFPGVSRPAISRHLRILRECDVVRAERRGKEQRYTLHARPLQNLREGWLASFTDHGLESLQRLRRVVEGGPD